MVREFDSHAWLMEKDQLTRMAVIVDSLQGCDRTKEDLRQRVIRKTGWYVCTSQIEKDLRCLRQNLDAPIRYSKQLHLYTLDNEDYKFWYHFLKYWSEYIQFPKEIRNLINE